MISAHVKLITTCSCICLSILCFLYGYFPLQTKLKTSNFTDSFDQLITNSESDCPAFQEWRKQRDVYQQPLLDRLVLIVIDALRYDFVFSENRRMTGVSYSPSMPFLNRLINSGHASTYEANVQPPTVTMPRIKAITAGIVPAFADVVLNFAGSEFLEDNIITKAHHAGLKIIYYGDDTWIRLFPHRFERSEGVTSFVVTDYTEVDLNVSRHLASELHQLYGSWDIMVLHYIGLDHIGHAFGPSSPLVVDKLLEMDRNIETIYTAMSERNETFTIVILGDHGMTDIGSHGGASRLETTVPLIFLNDYQADRFHFTNGRVQQVDLAPTLAALLGLPPLINNIGIVLQETLQKRLLKEQPHQKRLKMVNEMHRNLIQILRLFVLNSEAEDRLHVVGNFEAIRRDYQALLLKLICGNDSNAADSTDKLIESINSRSRQLMKHMQDHLIKASVRYNDNAIIVGLCGLIASLIVCFSECKTFVISNISQRHSVQFLLFGLVLHCVSMASSSFIEEEHVTWYFLWTTYLMFGLWNQINCSKRNTSSISCKLAEIGAWSLALLCSRIMRSWNAAGIKWRHLETLSEHIKKEETLVTTLSALLICYLLAAKCRSSAFSKVLSIIAVILMCFGSGFQAWTTTAIRCIYVLCLALGVSGNLFCCVVVMSVVLLKFWNLPILVMILLTQRAVDSMSDNQLQRILTHYYLAMASYFYLGNSNSIGHVDVSAGYVGVNDYIPVINGALVLAHLYAGPMLAIASGRDNGRNCKRSDKHVSEIAFVVLSLRGSSAAFNLMMAYVQRYHLFVWSVFAPKVLYECLHMTLVCALVLITEIKRRF